MSNTSANAQSVPFQTDSKPKAFIKKSANFVKTHKKTTIAVGLLTGLVVANAVLDKKAVVTLSPVKVDVTDAPSIEVIDSSN